MRDSPRGPLAQKQPVGTILRREDDGFGLAQAELGQQELEADPHRQRTRRDPRGKTDAGGDFPRHGPGDDDLAKQIVRSLIWLIWLRAMRGLESLTTRVTAL